MDRELIARLIGDLERLHAGLDDEPDSAAGAFDGKDVDRAQWLAGILAHSPDVISVLDLAGMLLYVSRTPTGQDPAPYSGHHSSEFVPPPFRDAWMQALERAVESGQPQHVEVFSSGDFYWDTRIVPIRQSGRVTWLLTIGTDITAQRRAEAALAMQHEQLQLALEASGMGQWSWDIANDRVVWDSATKKIFDWPEEKEDIDFSAFLERVHPADRERVRKAVMTTVESGGHQTIQCRIVLSDASTRWIFCKGRVLKDGQGKACSLLGGVMDVTHAKRTDEQLQRAAKLEAIGQLAGGVAHDFNNLLVAILGNIDLAKLCQDERERSQRLADATEAANRAAELTRQLLVFGRRQPLEQAPVDCHALLDDTLRLLGRLLPETIRVELRRAADLPRVFGDRGQLEQVVVNLCLNARDAMPRGGTLCVETELTHVDSRFRETRPWARPGNYVVIRVTDTGIGIAPDQLDHVFEPFYTTKSSGTGLGLATAYGVVKRHGGLLHVRSEVGRGTTFEAFLPAAEQAPLEARSETDQPERGGRETILLAEDEAAVGAVITRMLERVGYRVVSVEDGQQAVDRYRDAPEKFSLLLFDAVMPRKGGPEAIAEIRALNPDIPAIVCSGYTEAAGSWGGIGERVQFVAKPYEPDHLLGIMRRLLDKPS